MRNILIYNNICCHYEIIESIIHKFTNIIITDISQDIITIKYIENIHFKKYINNKYKNIIFTNNMIYNEDNYDIIINCTVYNKDIQSIKKLNKNNKKYIFIAHEITNELKEIKNIYFLTPLCNNNNYFYCDILPFYSDKKKTNEPIFIIQGSINNMRRNFNLLDNILNNKYDYKFKIKIIGHSGNKSFAINNNLIIKSDLNFIDYHKEFIDAYCILPLISYETHPMYYNNKLTSTINYAKGYNLKILLDNKLQSIYNMNNAYVYNNTDEFIQKFKFLIKEFYDN